MTSPQEDVLSARHACVSGMHKQDQLTKNRGGGCTSDLFGVWCLQWLSLLALHHHLTA